MANVVRKSGGFVYFDDGSVAQQMYQDNAPDANSVTPVDIQSRLAQTIQTHNAVNVAASGFSAGSSWIDCDGFDKIAFTLLNDNGTSSTTAFMDWSNDGTTKHGSETILSAGTGANRAGITDIKARYARPNINNGDGAAAHTISAWAYLKA